MHFQRCIHTSRPLAASLKDPYGTLGVKRDASAADIKKAYFALARKYHPDTNPDKADRDKFVQIQEAYDILKDDAKRKSYDQYGAASQQQGFDPNAFSQGFSGFGSGFEFTGGGADLFESLFGGAFSFGGNGPRGFQASQGEMLETSINISFLEACKGASKTIYITPVVNCKICGGSGLRAGAKRTKCGTCKGKGTQTYVIQNGFHMTSNCRACDGTGSRVAENDKCQPCGGMGKVRERTSVDIRVPAGVEDGNVIAVRGAGDAALSPDGQRGDLLVRVHVAPSKAFVRQGSNLYHEARIPLQTALLGGKVRVPTLDGDVDVRVPGCTQQGEEMVMKGRGVVSPSSSRKGDLFIKFAVQLPRSLTKQQKNILQQYADDVAGVTSESTRSSQADDQNGTVCPSRQPSGWLSGAWSKLRELTGF
ncbi:hypothetical protein FISHEDRAFT_37575 [Fistulina hepatica ATCC 64428]|uniref:DnaJ homolog 1, mitochondrial n=1 Tax=Fistulina hepatica ATCC 64428 TaxID=1128425 RepID=A0A0D7AHJ5_9AGAR|nr:hypothetical protein FISHEDRAFT_37575 [Fistulina hepatica ATCC 64428]